MGGSPPPQSGQRPFLLSVWKTGAILLPGTLLGLAIISIPAFVLAEALRRHDFSVTAQDLGVLFMISVVGLYLVYSTGLLGGALVAGRPFVEIGPDGIVGTGFFGWKSLKWSEIEEAVLVGGLGLASTIRVRGIDRSSWERVLRTATLGIVGNRIFVLCLYLREPASDVVAAFNRNCPGHLRL